jgi:hypothetical protein
VPCMYYEHISIKILAQMSSYRFVDDFTSIDPWQAVSFTLLHLLEHNGSGWTTILSCTPLSSVIHYWIHYITSMKLRVMEIAGWKPVGVVNKMLPLCCIHNGCGGQGRWFISLLPCLDSMLKTVKIWVISAIFIQLWILIGPSIY